MNAPYPLTVLVKIRRGQKKLKRDSRAHPNVAKATSDAPNIVIHAANPPSGGCPAAGDLRGPPVSTSFEGSLSSIVGVPEEAGLEWEAIQLRTYYSPGELGTIVRIQQLPGEGRKAAHCPEKERKSRRGTRLFPVLIPIISVATISESGPCHDRAFTKMKRENNSVPWTE